MVQLRFVEGVFAKITELLLRSVCWLVRPNAARFLPLFTHIKLKWCDEKFEVGFSERLFIYQSNKKLSSQLELATAAAGRWYVTIPSESSYLHDTIRTSTRFVDRRSYSTQPVQSASSQAFVLKGAPVKGQNKINITDYEQSNSCNICCEATSQ